MKAVTWQGTEEVRVEEVPDPSIEQPTDAIVRITSTGPCGSDLHLYTVLGMFIDPGDVLGHEPMGVAERLRDLTDGRGPDSAIDAVGMEAHGAPSGELAQKTAAFCRTPWRKR